MPKSRTVFVCSDCGADYAKWQGQCNACGEWNTLSQLAIKGAGSAMSRAGYAGEKAEVRTLDQVDIETQHRILTGSSELDRVLGGGMVGGSAILIGGSPGAGKSTLLLQVLSHTAASADVLYVTGEESLAQVALRAKRLRLSVDRVSVMAETSLSPILATWDELKPQLVVIDSIQAMYTDTVESVAGSVGQVRETAGALIRQAKQTNTILIVIGHVTKDGGIAGPRLLEHMIDTFVMFDGESDSRYRSLRSSKNRFGAVNEVGLFAMTETGLREVTNPSAIFLRRDAEVSPGSVVMVIWEGSRPLLVEAQALVDDSMGSYPRRVTVGFDQNRLAMLLAVLHRHGGIQVGDQDVFANAVGGVRVDETASDLSLLAAVVSSFRDRALPRDLVCFGEVGLSGEIRPVPHGQERLQEAAKHGFKRAIVPGANAPRKPIEGMQVTSVSKLTEALAALE